MISVAFYKNMWPRLEIFEFVILFLEKFWSRIWNESVNVISVEFFFAENQDSLKMEAKRAMLIVINSLIVA